VSDHVHPVDPDRVLAVREGGLPIHEAKVMASLLTLLVDTMRSRILAALLVADELCVGDLALALDATEDSVSYALRLLRTAGLVRRRREGRMAFYRPPDGHARSVLEAGLASMRNLAQLHPEAAAEDLDLDPRPPASRATLMHPTSLRSSNR
jgi:DNA-binding transcriptional ArsR family regulator